MIDVHNHIGLSQDGGNGRVSELLKIMKACKISRSVIFATDEQDRGLTFEKPNERILEVQQQYPDKFIAFCRINPGAGEKADKEFRLCCRRGARGLKLKASDGFEPREARSLLQLVKNRRDFPVIIHIAHNEHSQPKKWAPLFEDFPSIHFILAHSGKDHYKECIRLAKLLPNIFLETSTLSFHRTRRIYESAGPEKMIFGSDYPYSRPETEILKYELMLKNKADREMVFFHNTNRIMGLL